MTVDVVKRLTENAHVLEAHRYTTAADVMREAAAEIERLRLAVETSMVATGSMIATALRWANDAAVITDRECSAALAISELLAPVVLVTLGDGLVLRWEDGLNVHIEEIDRC